MTAQNNTLNTQKKELHFKTFLTALLAASAFFLPFMFIDNGYFIFFGDFNVQQVPFYQMCHRAVRSGDIFWNWQTDLGANFIGSYTFYLLGSPFFWITLLFPNWMVPYLMGPLLILKFAFAAFCAYFYIRRFTKTPDSAMLGALLYAFSGFSVYNIFFNHFHEAIILFPLLLLGLERFIVDKKRGVFALAVFATAFSNYFFFFGMVIFTVIYWIVRTVHDSWKIKLKEFFLLFFEAVLGVLLASCLLLPSFYAIIDNDRISSMLSGWNGLLYSKNQLYLNIIEIFFFPPDIPARPVFFTDANAKWSSLGAWLPVFSMTGVVAFMTKNKKNWLSRIIWICSIMAFIPILNSAFYMFNTAYYARWFYMPILIMCLMTALSTEDEEIEWKPAWNRVFGITAAIALTIGLFPTVSDGKIERFGLYTYSEGEAYPLRFWGAVAIAAVSLIILRIILRQIKKDRELFYRLAITSVFCISIIYSAVFIGTGKCHSYDEHTEVIPNYIEGNVALDGDSDTFRIDTYDGIDNTGMILGYNCINAFHSIVPPSVTEFYEFVGEERGVASRPEADNYALRSLLSVKYLLNRSQGDDFAEEEAYDICWDYIGEQNGYRVFQNRYYIPYGFTYDHYISLDDCDSYPEEQRASVMLNAIVLNDEQIARHSDILSDIKTYGFVETDEVALENICLTRASSAAVTFNTDNNGFSSKVNLISENLVFYSVPYDSGWKALVDGVEVPIEKVNVGFMAVRVGAGAHDVRFIYTTPGLELGIILSLSALAVFIIYIILCFAIKRHKIKKAQRLDFEKQIDESMPIKHRYIPSAPDENDVSDKEEEIDPYKDIDPKKIIEDFLSKTYTPAEKRREEMPSIPITDFLGNDMSDNETTDHNGFNIDASFLEDTNDKEE